MKWNIFKPRRAIRESVKEGSKKNIVLEDGELMVVRKSADGALVKGVKSDIYIGNGTTTMEELKPALYGDTSEEPITVTPDESPDSTTALNKVTSGKPLSELVGSLKRAIETGGGGGADLNQDIISLNSNDDPYSEISFYISGDQTAPEPIDTIDNLPLKDSYADKFMYELDVVDSTITSTTTPVDITDYYENNLVVMHGVTVGDQSSGGPPYLSEYTYYEIPELIHLHHHKCHYLGDDEDPYMYFYYYYDDYSKYEVWSRSVPLAVDGLGSSSSYTGLLVSYDYETEAVEVVYLGSVSNNDIVLFVDGTRSYSNQFPQWASTPSSRTNIIKYNSTDADSETAIIQFLKLTYDLNYDKKSYGIFVDFVHGFMGDKYLVFPIWNEVFAKTIQGNKFIKGAVTSPLVEGEFAVFEYRTDFIEYSDSIENVPLYEGVFHLFDPIDVTNKKLLVQKNPLGTKYPASFVLYDYVVSVNSDIDTEVAKESLYVEFSKNGLQYSRYTRGSGGSNEGGEIIIALDNEVHDARIGVDNTTYDNLGIAIRTQVSDLKTYVNNQIDDVKALIDNSIISAVNSIY